MNPYSWNKGSIQQKKTQFRWIPALSLIEHFHMPLPLVVLFLFDELDYWIVTYAFVGV
jgi:hypothetical protein